MRNSGNSASMEGRGFLNLSMFCILCSHRFKDHPTLNDRYLLLHLLGRGGFSEVYKVSLRIEFLVITNLENMKNSGNCGLILTCSNSETLSTCILRRTASSKIK